jgi:hypothetical protein
MSLRHVLAILAVVPAFVRQIMADRGMRLPKPSEPS